MIFCLAALGGSRGAPDTPGSPPGHPAAFLDTYPGVGQAGCTVPPTAPPPESADETLHGRIGVALLSLSKGGRTGAWLPWPGDAQIEALVRPYLAAMRVRDVVEPDEEALFDDALAAEELRAVGIPHSGEFRDAYHHALTHDVAAGFQTLGLGSNSP